MRISLLVFPLAIIIFSGYVQCFISANMRNLDFALAIVIHNAYVAGPWIICLAPVYGTWGGACVFGQGLNSSYLGF